MINFVLPEVIIKATMTTERPRHIVTDRLDVLRAIQEPTEHVLWEIGYLEEMLRRDYPDAHD